MFADPSEKKLFVQSYGQAKKDENEVFRFYPFLMRKHMICAHICKNWFSIYLKIMHTYFHTLPPGSVTKILFPNLGIVFADTLPRESIS